MLSTRVIDIYVGVSLMRDSIALVWPFPYTMNSQKYVYNMYLILNKLEEDLCKTVI